MQQGWPRQTNLSGLYFQPKPDEELMDDTKSSNTVGTNDKKDPSPPATNGGEAAGSRLRIDTSGLTSSYCNVCNASSTREEIVLNFGVTHDWDRRPDADVKMLHRI